MSPTPVTALGRPLSGLVWAGLVVLTVLAAASLYHRSFYIDDAWLGERAYWLAREGAVRSELFSGLVGYGERHFVFHKLFALTGAAFVTVFGWSLYVLKSVSLISFFAFLGLLRLYCRRFESPGVFPVAALVLLAHGLVGRHIFIYRPEIMLMTLGFASFLLLRSFLERGHWGRLMGGAGLAGLCALTHLNGLVFIAAGVVLLVSRRRVWAAVAFAVTASGVAALYVSDAVWAGELQTLIQQFRGDPQLDERLTDAGGRLMSVVTEHRRYFHSLTEIAFSILVLGVGGLTFRQTGLRSSPLLPYSLGLMVPLAVLTPEKQTYYALPVLPYLALIVAGGVVSGLPRLGRGARIAVLSLVCLFWLNGVIGLGRIVATNTDTPSRSAALAARMGPPRTPVLATLSFIFDEIENRRVRGLTYYWIQNRFGRYPIPPDALFEDAKAQGAAYVVMSREDLKFSGWAEGSLPSSGPHHKKTFEDEDHLILEIF